jgi:putative intracellular protease/amidase
MSQETLPTSTSTPSTACHEPPADTPRRVLVARFVRHYVEMVLAMVAGMMILSPVVGMTADVFGITYTRDTQPTIAAVEMALTMSAGMAFWMRYRRHHRRHVADMTAAMVLPLVVLLPLTWTGVVAGSSLMMLEHVAMLPLMLVAMLRTPRAYTGPVVGRLDSLPRLRKVLRRLVTAAVVVAVPVGVGAAGVAIRSADLYSPAESTVPVAATSATLPAHDTAKPTAVVVVGAKGAEVGDTLGSFETLAASKAFNTYLASPERVAVPLTGGLDVVPQVTFAQLGSRLGGKAPDVIIVPAMPDTGESSNAAVTTWLKAEKANGALVMSVCDGAAVIASAGLLDGHRATSHWYRIGGLERGYPDTTWERGTRYVDDGDVITTAGILSGIDGTLHVIERLADQDTARAAATAVGWRHYSPARPAAIPASTVGPLTAMAPLNAAFRSRPTIGVRLADGADEIALASVFDTYSGQSFAAEMLSTGPGRQPIISRHGLEFVPRADAATADVDRVITPGGGGSTFPFDATLADLARTADAPTARWAAKLLEYHPAELTLAGSRVSWTLLARPVMLGLATLALLVGAGRLRRRFAGGRQSGLAGDAS